MVVRLEKWKAHLSPDPVANGPSDLARHLYVYVDRNLLVMDKQDVPTTGVTDNGLGLMSYLGSDGKSAAFPCSQSWKLAKASVSFDGKNQYSCAAEWNLTARLEPTRVSVQIGQGLCHVHPW